MLLVLFQLTIKLSGDYCYWLYKRKIMCRDALLLDKVNGAL